MQQLTTISQPLPITPPGVPGDIPDTTILNHMEDAHRSQRSQIKYGSKSVQCCFYTYLGL
ncbi:hypothetical protein X777_02680 [Ooceraea biroi]|uniref:Uncharacterized protein n=1 Tax=Ooceraea biroi TaxID=2015173 RepID=A0A026WNZ5_OOCBI|nr:hypothetical protein X777_02680 [Ooceraea biroi]